MDTSTDILAPAADLRGDTPAGVMRMLAARVPLSLLLDLSMPQGPRSAEILHHEGRPEGTWWESA